MVETKIEIDSHKKTLFLQVLSVVLPTFSNLERLQFAAAYMLPLSYI